MSQSSSSGVGHRILSFLMTFVIVFGILFIVNSSVIINAKVPSSSMENTIMTGERLFGNRLAYTNHAPQRYDIVIFRYPDNPKTYFVKRIIGLPGEILEVKNGKVYINHQSTPLRDDFVKETPKGNFGPVKIPQNEYFMMGDNRNNSWDSRFWKHKTVPFDYIVAKAGMVYYPFSRFGQKVSS